MSRAGNCPSLDNWRRFVLGQTSEAEAQQMEGHLTGCPECLSTLFSLQTKDTLVEAIRGQRRTEEPDNAAVTELIGRLGARPPLELRKESEGATAGLPTPLVAGESTLPPTGDALGTVGGQEILECLAPAQSADEIGRLGSYRVLRLLGVGGMGVVFQAEDTVLQRQVALKTLLPSLTVRPSARQRFLREARAAAAIDHEHVIHIFQVGEDHGVPFLTMPFLKGESLEDRLKREGRLPLAEVLRIGRETAAGLAAAHEHGVIHRDIKPANVWLEARGEGEGGRVKILDFGLARALADDTQLTQQGMVMGTPSYMAPEQINGQTVDARADLFSLGCVLYRMATGRLPFEGNGTLAILAAVGTATPLPPRTLCPDLPQALDELILWLLAKAPEDRPVSAGAVVEALSALEADVTGLLRPPPSSRARGRSAGKGRRRLAVAVLAGLFLAVLLAGIAIFRAVTDQGEIVIYTDDPDVELVVRQAGKVVEIMDLKSQRKVVLHSGEYTLSLGGEPPGLKIEAPDTFVLRRGDRQIVRIRRVPLPNPELLYAIEWQDVEQGFPANIYQTGISADGKLFFGAGDAGPTGSIRIFEVATGKQVQDLRLGANAWFSFAAFVSGSDYLAAAYSQEKDIFLWDIATGKIVRKLTGHTEPGANFAVSTDGKRLLSWCNDKTLRLWDVQTGKELRKLEGHTDGAAGLFSPDGKKVLTFGSPDKTLRLWDVETGKQLLKLEGHAAACTGSFSPDGKQALSFGADNTIRLWDLDTGKEIRRFAGGNVKDGARGFVAGGRQVAAYCDDQRFRVWDTASGKVVREINLASAGGDRWTMTASPDGRLGLVNHQDGSVRVFDLTTGKEIHRYEGCRKARAFSFSPDGNFAVAGSFRAGLFVFRLPPRSKGNWKQE